MTIPSLRITQVRIETLEDDLLIQEARKGWSSLSEEEKIETAVAEAEIPILKCMEKKREEDI